MRQLVDNKRCTLESSSREVIMVDTKRRSFVSQLLADKAKP